MDPMNRNMGLCLRRHLRKPNVLLLLVLMGRNLNPHLTSSAACSSRS
ncbi:hypothetical protein ACJIZ3_020831 [Penstemon smallii]|uniref:Uncharacterized protein n=1 Tax=Penstemon smallii TaxID=265156 RepID=A0ABD3SJX6_9LAMI